MVALGAKPTVFKDTHERKLHIFNPDSYTPEELEWIEAQHQHHGDQDRGTAFPLAPLAPTGVQVGRDANKPAAQIILPHRPAPPPAPFFMTTQPPPPQYPTPTTAPYPMLPHAPALQFSAPPLQPPPFNIGTNNNSPPPLCFHLFHGHNICIAGQCQHGCCFVFHSYSRYLPWAGMSLADRAARLGRGLGGDTTTQFAPAAAPAPPKRKSGRPRNYDDAQ